jgi:cell division protein FtsB|tara:strand:+ start:306 stop:587 length:282 start_codon:yes stop_codon:yes gene_type:complete
MDLKLFKLIFLLSASLLIGILINDGIQIYLLNDKNRNVVENKKFLKSENLSLSTEIELLKNNKSYILLMAREKLGMIADGEVVYKFIQKENSK